MRSVRFVALLAATTLSAACGAPEVPAFSLSARPRVLDPATAVESTITAEVFEDDGKARSGTVRLTTTAGAFGNGSTEQRLTLAADGTASTKWSCSTAADPNCKGLIRIDGRWEDPMSGQFLVAALRIELKGATP